MVELKLKKFWLKKCILYHSLNKNNLWLTAPTHNRWDGTNLALSNSVPTCAIRTDCNSKPPTVGSYKPLAVT